MIFNIKLKGLACLFLLVGVFLNQARAAGFVMDVKPEYPEVQEGLCGSAKSIHSYLEQSGYFSEPILSGFSIYGDRMIYLPKIDRVKKTVSGVNGHLDQDLQKQFGIGAIIVTHQDRNASNPEGLRCIKSRSSIGDDERKRLTEYFKSIEAILDAK